MWEMLAAISKRKIATTDAGWLQRGVQHVCAERRRGFGRRAAALQPPRRPPSSPSEEASEPGAEAGAGCSGRRAAAAGGLQQSFPFGTGLHRRVPPYAAAAGQDGWEEQPFQLLEYQMVRVGGQI